MKKVYEMSNNSLREEAEAEGEDEEERGGELEGEEYCMKWTNAGKV